MSLAGRRLKVFRSFGHQTLQWERCIRAASAYHGCTLEANAKPALMADQQIPIFSTRLMPPWLWLLFGLYSLSSLAHFAHNAEFLAFYPGLPAWMSREGVYAAWLAVAGLGLLGLASLSRGWLCLGAMLIAAYGVLGLDGLLHYRLGLCAEHTWVANLTIFAEVLSGVALALSVVVWAGRRWTARPSAPL